MPSSKDKAIPHNSKCRYGERGVADAKPKAQIISFNVQNNVIEKIEETEELQNTLQETIKKIIEKAKNTKTIVEVTKNDDYEYEIWKNILQLRVIKLEDISLKITKDKEKYFMQIFDEGAFEEKTQIFISTTINEKQIKINKKIKIFE